VSIQHQTTPHPDSVGHLVRAAQAGDRTAFGRLHDRYAHMVHAIAASRVPPGEADDVVQEAFLRALRQLGGLRNGEAFGPWLAAIARNTAADVYRKRHPHGELVEEPARRSHQHEDTEAQVALAAIRALPEAYRETVMMRLVEGMTGPEIADRTGLSPASVRVNLHRGIKLLRRRLAAAEKVRA
jgi:RNA polymerase sigma-70 factor (ECF subfamily)